MGRNTRGQHEPEVAQSGHTADLALSQQPLPGLALVLPCGQGNLPGVGRFERVLDELFPGFGLFCVFGLGVTKKQHVAQLHPAFAVVLGKLVGIELRERRRQSALHSCRQWLLAGLPIESNELAEFVGSLDDLCQRIRHQRACALLPSQLPRQEKRNMAQLHLVACLAGKRGYVRGLIRRHKCARRFATSLPFS